MMINAVQLEVNISADKHQRVERLAKVFHDDNLSIVLIEYCPGDMTRYTLVCCADPRHPRVSGQHPPLASFPMGVQQSSYWLGRGMMMPGYVHQKWGGANDFWQAAVPHMTKMLRLAQVLMYGANDFPPDYLTEELKPWAA